MKRTLIVALLIVGACLVLATSVTAMNLTNYRIDWMVPLTASGGSGSSSQYAVQVSVGQTSIDTGSSTHYRLCAGYWCGVPAQFWLRLPLIQR